MEMLGAIGQGGEGIDRRVLLPPLGRDLGEVAAACDGNHRRRLRCANVQPARPHPRAFHNRFLGELVTQSEKDAVDARVAELARDRCEHRDLLVGRLEGDPVSPPLLAHVAQRVVRAALVGLVDDDHRGEIEHVDLLELARGTVLARHHVHRNVGQVDDLRIALSDPGGLDEHEAEPLRP